MDASAVAVEVPVRPGFDPSSSPEIHLNPDLANQPGFFTIFFTLIFSFISPLIFVTLQHFGPKYFKVVTLSLMWIFGFLFGIYFQAKLFVGLWIIYSLLNLHMYWRSKNRIADSETPRTIYKYFLFTFKLNYFFAIASMLVFTFYSLFFVDPVVQDAKQIERQDFLLYIFACSLYFGVLNRDFAEVCAETIAINIGYFSPNAFAKKTLDHAVCGICNKLLFNADPTVNSMELTRKISCNHEFHDFCIRGWCLIGKKNICPLCREKVNLSETFTRPWDKVDVMYGSFLDTFRYFAGWMPAMILLWRANMKLFHVF